MGAEVDPNETLYELITGKNYLRNSDFWYNLFVSLYAVLISTAVIGNLAVIGVILCRQRLHTVTNVFVVTLAVSDVLKSLFNYPIELYNEIHGPMWTLGKDLCYVVQPTFGVTVYSSAITMLAIAVDRYRRICHPHNQQLRLRWALAVVGCVLALSFCLASPMLAFTHFDEVRIDYKPYNLHLKLTYCTERWPDDASRLVFTVATFLLQFCVPLLITSLLYCAIARVLWRRPARNRRLARQRRTIALLVLIVLLYFCCWLPTTLFSTLVELSLNNISAPLLARAVPYLSEHVQIKVLVLKAFALSSTCLNPVLYGWLNKQVKIELHSIVGMTSFYRRRTTSTNRCAHSDVRAAEGANVRVRPGESYSRWPAALDKDESTPWPNMALLPATKQLAELARRSQPFPLD